MKNFLAILLLSIFATSVICQRCSGYSDEDWYECLIYAIEVVQCPGLVDYNGCLDDVIPYDSNNIPLGCNTMCSYCLDCLDAIGGACCRSVYYPEDLPTCYNSCIARYPGFP